MQYTIGMVKWYELSLNEQVIIEQYYSLFLTITELKHGTYIFECHFNSKIDTRETKKVHLK